ncbi:MAG: efflux RND transporter permease subunit [Acidiferrobacterales bacterium]|nr:efflux RND transporter permease subunit [Acidiferrobacterales bacterium]
MNIGEYSVRNKVTSWLFVIILVGGGILGFESMGKLEDPAFTIKQAKIITYYPGASPRQVQDEVTYHIEDALQRLEQLKRIRMSISRPGMSDITVEFKDKYKAKDFPDIFDELRRKIVDMQSKLPPGAQPPIVIDDFGDVYGIFGAITGDGYSYRDLKDVADEIKKQLVLVPGVRKIEIAGDRREVVYVEISRARLGELGIPLSKIKSLLSSQNTVVDAGRARVGDEYIRISPTGEFASVKEIGDLLVGSDEGRLIYLKDIATIRRAYQEIPEQLIYSKGKPALTMGISMLGGENVVAVGERVRQRLQELGKTIPVGIEFNPIYVQPTEVQKSVSSFIVSVLEALVIVIAVLLVFMGLQTGLIIGAVLMITVAGTLWIMQLYGIELQRISLGALVIALGMLVDNAIVVAEGMLVRIKAGMDATKAAGEVVGKSIWALLGGTVIGILAFSAIGLSDDNTGEFASSLFYVILISLMLSWFTAVSTAPLLCALWIKPDTGGDADADPYGGKLFQVYKRFLQLALYYRLQTVAAVLALFVLAVVGFGFVKQAFFPSSNTPMFFVDVWEVEGTDIRKTRDVTLRISSFLREQPGVTTTTSFVGGGASRFTLTYEPKERSSAYAQIIVQTESREQIAEVWAKVDEFMAQETPQNEPIIKAMRIGPGRDGKIEARFHGPDDQVLRELAEKAKAIFRADADAKEIRDDWRQPAKRIVPVFNEQVGRQLGVTREDLADALNAAFDGVRLGVYRDGIRQLPIFMRAPTSERADVGNMQDVQVWSPVLNKSVPVSQVVSAFETHWENSVIRGRNRIQTIIASCNPKGELASPLFKRIRPKVEALELPPGYSLSWGGEYEDSINAQQGLGKALPAGFLVMIITSILLFGKVRQPLIIWLTVPLAVIGVTVGLLGARGAFDFMALLGALSLIGLLIKNAIVLIEEIDQQIDEGKNPYDGIVDSAVSRLRPVTMAAVTTILGMIPLLQDVFFVNMSLTIMFGLGFATILTLIIVPVLYAILFKVKIPSPK